MIFVKMLKQQVRFKNSAERVGKLMDLYDKTNKEASTVLCSVVKHSRNGKAPQQGEG